MAGLTVGPEDHDLWWLPTPRERAQGRETGQALAGGEIVAHAARQASTLASLRVWLEQYAADGKEVTTDEAHWWLDRLGQYTKADRRFLGALWHYHDTDGQPMWEALGWKPSDRSECHARPVRVWRLRRPTYVRR